MNSDEHGLNPEPLSEDDLNSLTERIIGCAFRVSNSLGSGFLESVYHNALAHELVKNGLHVSSKFPVQVDYDGVVVGEFVVDILVEGAVVVELKATEDHHDVFTAQCLNYLRATGKPVCLLLNFGKPRLDIKRLRNKI